MIEAGMALVEDRFPASVESVFSLKGQVDRIHLSLNGFKEVPPEFKEDWIRIQHIGKNIGDIGKFPNWLPANVHGVLTCDDDLVYPFDYVARFLEAEKRYPDTALSFHGRQMSGQTDDYFRMVRDAVTTRCLSDAYKDIPVSVIGTGCAYFPRSVYFEMKVEMGFGYNCADLVVSKALKTCGIPAMALAHSSDTFKYLPPIGTIWDEAWNNQERMTALWNEFDI